MPSQTHDEYSPRDGVVAASPSSLDEAVALAHTFLNGTSLVLEAESPQLREELSHRPVLQEPVLFMRTSGTTSGTGKVVVLPQNSLLASAHATEQALGGPGRWATCLPTNHIAGFHTVFRSLLAGYEPYGAGRGRPTDIAAAAKAARSMPGERFYISLVPTQLQRLLDSPYAQAAREFDAILVGGAASSDSLLRRAHEAGLAIWTTYGMTETAGGCVYNGLPIGDTRVSIDDAGRIHIAGPTLAWGYVGSSPFGGELTTNDVGGWVDGRLEVLGRIDDAITTGGMTIHPAIIEAAARELGVTGFVVGIPDDEWGESAVLILAEETEPRGKIREGLAARLDRTYIPRYVVSLSDLNLTEIPMNATGKVMRRSLKEAALAWSQRLSA
ncbi:AMP-binding protein [Arcanobacterium haemolyticum]|nr:AMP-binding protein [Arcanobacterium haemolyticum]